jgi:hypothetical protein
MSGKSCFPGNHIKLPREFLDHNPLVVDSQAIPRSKSRMFKFEICWLQHPDFLDKVKTIWEIPTRDFVALDRVLFKLKKVKTFLKEWGFNLSGSRKKRGRKSPYCRASKRKSGPKS